MNDLGPQSPSDNPFTARMRLHQSWYRASVLGVPCGTGPRPASTKHYGNMLRREDGARGLNFLTPVIFEVARARLAKARGVVEPFRLLHNMLSSQPMCFNLFGPLVMDLDLATLLMRQLLPGEVQRVTAVKIEHAPAPASEYLDDSTAFDAFVEYARSDGSEGFVGVETKLTEPFSHKHYDRPTYRRWMKDGRGPWRDDAWFEVSKTPHNQLWRDHLLAVATLRRARSKYTHGALMLVRHPGDRSCDKIVRRYQGLLCAGADTFIDVPLDDLVKRFGRAELQPDARSWLAAFEQRYLRLAESAAVRT